MDAAKASNLNFLGWDEVYEGQFNQESRIR